MKRSITDPKVQGEVIIRHYVIGGYPGDAAIRESGAIDQAGYYVTVLQAIQGWSRLTFDEIQQAIEGSPETIENTTDKPNFKPLYLEALDRMRRK
jgi:hypothetical protein